MIKMFEKNQRTASKSDPELKRKEKPGIKNFSWITYQTISLYYMTQDHCGGFAFSGEEHHNRDHSAGNKVFLTVMPHHSHLQLQLLYPQ